MSAMSQDYEQADIYKDLRAQALGLNAAALDSHDGIFALLMETGYEEAVATILAAADGSASMYFSNGGGLIGAGEYEQVQEVVFETLVEAKKYTASLEKTEQFPLPDVHHVRIYLVMEGGVLSAAGPHEAMGEGEHELSPLFHQVHKLIAYMNAAEQHRQSQSPE